MTSDECRAYLLRPHDGEVYGESLFGALATGTTDEDRRHKWRVLARLERETKERITAVLDRAGIVIPGSSASVQRGEADARRLSRVPWRDVMEGFRRELERFVTEFERAEALESSGREVGDLLRHITNHERALLEFVTRELEDRSEHSLQPVLALLRNPNVR